MTEGTVSPTPTETIECTDAPTTGAGYRRVVAGLLRPRPRHGGLPSTTYVVPNVAVDVDRLAAYDQVCGFRLADTVPPTYPHVLAFPLAMYLMSDPVFPLGVIGLVHVGNRIEQARPIRIDERLRLSVHAEDLRPHERGRQFDVVATATVDGVEVWRGVSTYLRRSAASSPRVSVTAPTDEVGTVATGRWAVGRDVGRAYAHVSGDRNPIHTSRLGARAFGFRRPIAHGMWSLARCVAAFEGRLPDAYAIDVAFRRPIPLPATLTFAESPDLAFSLADTKSGAPHVRGRIG